MSFTTTSELLLSSYVSKNAARVKIDFIFFSSFTALPFTTSTAKKLRWLQQQTISVAVTLVLQPSALQYPANTHAHRFNGVDIVASECARHLTGSALQAHLLPKHASRIFDLKHQTRSSLKRRQRKLTLSGGKQANVSTSVLCLKVKLMGRKRFLTRLLPAFTTRTDSSKTVPDR